jgi:hypothetical protein
VCHRPSWSLALVVLVISLGLALLVAGETEFNLAGFVIVMVASALSGLRWTITQVLLQGSEAHGTGAQDLHPLCQLPRLLCSVRITFNLHHLKPELRGNEATWGMSGLGAGTTGNRAQRPGWLCWQGRQEGLWRCCWRSCQVHHEPRRLLPCSAEYIPWQCMHAEACREGKAAGAGAYTARRTQL